MLHFLRANWHCWYTIAVNGVNLVVLTSLFTKSSQAFSTSLDKAASDKIAQTIPIQYATTPFKVNNVKAMNLDIPPSLISYQEDFFSKNINMITGQRHIQTWQLSLRRRSFVGVFFSTNTPTHTFTHTTSTALRIPKPSIAERKMDSILDDSVFDVRDASSDFEEAPVSTCSAVLSKC